MGGWVCVSFKEGTKVYLPTHPPTCFDVVGKRRLVLAAEVGKEVVLELLDPSCCG